MHFSSYCKADDMAVFLQIDDAALAAIVPKFSGVTAADLSGCARINVDAARQLLAAHCPRLRHVDATWAGPAVTDADDGADDLEAGGECQWHRVYICWQIELHQM